jgi:hypothetical protein
MFLIAIISLGMSQPMAPAAPAAPMTRPAVSEPISRPMPVAQPMPISRPVSPRQAVAPEAQKPHFPGRQYWYSGLNEPNEPLADCYAREQAAALADLSGLGISLFGPFGPPCPPLLFPY